jgi:hypothetical protein
MGSGAEMNEMKKRRHCEERSDEAIQTSGSTGLLRLRLAMTE